MSRNILRIALAALFIVLAGAWWWSRWPNERVGDDNDGVAAVQTSPFDSEHETAQLEMSAAANERARELAVERVAPKQELKPDAGTDFVFTGRVVSRTDQKPIEGARIVVRHEVPTKLRLDRLLGGTIRMHPKTEPFPSRELRSNAEGLFTVSLSSSQSPRLDISAPGFSKAIVFPRGNLLIKSSSHRDVIIGSAESQSFKQHRTPEHPSDRPTLIELDAGATLAARVVRSDGTPLQGVTICVRGRLANLIRPPVVWSDSEKTEVGSAITGPGGRCAVTDLPIGVDVEITVLRGEQVLKPWFFAWPFTVGEVRELEIIVPSGCRIAGNVIVSNSKSARAQEVWLAGAGVAMPHYFSKRGEDVVDRTTVQGTEFAFEEVAPGDWWVGLVPLADYGAEPTKDSLDSRAAYVRVEEHDETKSVELRTHSGLYLRGRVVDPFGNGASRVLISARAEGVDGSLTSRSKADGTFTIGPVAPDRFTVMTLFGGELSRAPSVSATVDSGEVLLQLEPAGRIRGRVLDARTGQSLNANVYCAGAASERGAVSSVTCEETEGFECVGVPLGACHLTARTDDGRVGIRRDVSVTNGGGIVEADILVEPGATIVVRYRGTPKRHHMRALVSGATVAIEPLRPEHVPKIFVPAGTTVLQRFDGDQLLDEVTLELAAGEEKTWEFGDRL